MQDSDTGLIRFGFRDYDPSVGRWTARDPIGLSGGDNVYGYVQNDPVRLIDPSGLLGTFGALTGQVTAPGVSGNAGIVATAGTDSNGSEVVFRVDAVANASILAGGVSAGRGVSSGIFFGDASSFLSSEAISVDSSIGGVQIYIGKDGIEGVGLSGPSAGLGVSSTGPMSGLSLSESIINQQIIDLNKLVEELLKEILGESLGKECR